MPMPIRFRDGLCERSITRGKRRSNCSATARSVCGACKWYACGHHDYRCACGSFRFVSIAEFEAARLAAQNEEPQTVGAVAARTHYSEEIVRA